VKQIDPREALADEDGRTTRVGWLLGVDRVHGLLLMRLYLGLVDTA